LRPSADKVTGQDRKDLETKGTLMKIIKLQKKDYTNLVYLLKRARLVNKNDAYPQNVVVNETTYKQMKLAHKKKYKDASTLAIEVEFLNLGPNVLSKKDGGNALPNGYAIVIPLTKEETK
jgi:hypothetical protein